MTDCELVADVLCEMVADALADKDGEFDELAVTVDEPDWDAVIVEATESVAVAHALTVAVAVAVALGVDESVPDEHAEKDAVSVLLELADLDTEAVTVGDTEPATVAAGVALTAADADADTDIV